MDIIHFDIKYEAACLVDRDLSCESSVTVVDRESSNIRAID
jgi:hypothetical protein